MLSPQRRHLKRRFASGPSRGPQLMTHASHDNTLLPLLSLQLLFNCLVQGGIPVTRKPRHVKQLAPEFRVATKEKNNDKHFPEKNKRTRSKCFLSIPYSGARLTIELKPHLWLTALLLQNLSYINFNQAVPKKCACGAKGAKSHAYFSCLLYTSDAADE